MGTLRSGQQLGAYRIARLLGEGGMGAVYEARQEPLGRQVALKTLHPELSQNRELTTRFFNEAKVLGLLAHPSIVQVSDFGYSADGTAFLVMEYLRGESLGRRLKVLADCGERVPVLMALQLGFQIADVLTVAHAHGVIHRDLKPDNLMLVPDALVPGGERIKVLDFGIAKLVTDTNDPQAPKTATQAVMGTPSYMSPEQCAGAGQVDARTDVYALGCVLYAMLAGRPPFVGDGVGEILGMQQFKEPPPLLHLSPKVPTALADLVHRLLTKDKAQRPWMNEVANWLGALYSKQTGGGPVVRSKLPNGAEDGATVFSIQPLLTTLKRSLGERGSSTTRRGSLLRWAVALGALLAVGGLIAWIRQSPAKRTPAAIRLESREAQSLAAPEPTVAKSAPTPNSVSDPAAEPSTAADTTQPAASPTATVPAGRALVKWHIATSPDGCLVTDATGKVLGQTPLTLERAAAPGHLELRVSKPGYAEARLSLAQAATSSQVISLKPLPSPKRLRSPDSTGALDERPKPPAKGQPSKRSEFRYEE